MPDSDTLDNNAMTDGWFDPKSATFGDRVTGAREAAEMTQKELAKRLGVKLATLRGWEDDLFEPRANKLQMLAGLLNVSLTWLLDGVGHGVDAPGEEPLVSDDMQAVLGELRALKERANRTANRLGTLEKRLRRIVEEQAVG
ncbi:multiprotein-bridging factor 1 family protein [Aquicoccus sp. G2-2]|jgi:transcriptional regulator with XRE-family HTH domain|uniref:helix-turn-helix domain-containing protein n=1 Tax=Aquicoccus sp. G2-2 TaxID=3092120 RepID=UPI002ADF4FF2|nr:helix-turn-helix transcriptional regulator [Aquicoccus sp. G2-2]MEA1112658.1 helix-turn-helix transcriptional regulator [Aquicoccus sp. G2-2]